MNNKFALVFFIFLLVALSSISAITPCEVILAKAGKRGFFETQHMGRESLVWSKFMAKQRSELENNFALTKKTGVRFKWKGPSTPRHIRAMTDIAYELTPPGLKYARERDRDTVDQILKVSGDLGFEQGSRLFKTSPEITLLKSRIQEIKELLIAGKRKEAKSLVQEIAKIDLVSPTKKRIEELSFKDVSFASIRGENNSLEWDPSGKPLPISDLVSFNRSILESFFQVRGKAKADIDAYELAVLKASMREGADAITTSMEVEMVPRAIEALRDAFKYPDSKDYNDLILAYAERIEDLTKLFERI